MNIKDDNEALHYESLIIRYQHIIIYFMFFFKSTI